MEIHLVVQQPLEEVPAYGESLLLVADLDLGLADFLQNKLTRIAPPLLSYQAVYLIAGLDLHLASLGYRS